jgi:phosphatidylethanolamine/phosphatidyl-N-methylethanolamine N-methyltransferase
MEELGVISNLFNFTTEYIKYVDFYNWELILTFIMIVVCPTTWNLVARWEFHTKFFSKLTGDNRMAADIFAHILIEMGIFRNFMYIRVIMHQPNFTIENEILELVTMILGYLLIGIGFMLIFFSFYRLGIHGIYYADYFGILFNEIVTAFPYNILNNPLYVGSTMLFFGNALVYKSPVGILLSIVAWIMYKFASKLENPMTALIYSEENIKAVRQMNKERVRQNSLKIKNLIIEKTS